MPESEHGRNLHGRKWKVPEVQLRRLATRRREASMARTAIASADEANGWLKPEKTEEEQRGRKEAKGEAVTAAKCLILHPSSSLDAP